MSNWYNAVEHIVNCRELLAVMVISITRIVCKVLDFKREKQFLQFVSQDAPDNLHMGIIDSSARFELDLK